MIITDANLKHREILAPSEKGWAYRLQVEAIKKPAALRQNNAGMGRQGGESAG